MQDSNAGVVSRHPADDGEDRAPLGFGDAVSLIVGIVVGVSIFKVPGLVFTCVDSPALGLLAWLLGGVVALCGALCYAELATTWPRSGGDYEYLSRAWGRWAGFLFTWSHLMAILTGSIGAVAFVFADYAVSLTGWPTSQTAILATGAIVLLTGANLAGVRSGRFVQNLLTVAKVAGLAGLVVAGFSAARFDRLFESQPAPEGGPGFGLAMVLVLYAYGGWNDAAFVAAEVRDRNRALPRALICGTLAICGLYLLINMACVAGLGLTALRASGVPAADLMESMFGSVGRMAISLLVCISALGALNGLILAGSRVHAATGEDHALFRPLARWHSRLAVPARALLAQLTVSLSLVGLVGTARGRELIDQLVAETGLSAVSWDRFGGGFDALVALTAPVFWLFFLMTGCSVVILRGKEPERPRPFRTPLFPLTVLLFCGSCVFMIKSSVEWAGSLAAVGGVLLLAGLLLFGVSELLGRGE